MERGSLTFRAGIFGTTLTEREAAPMTPSIVRRQELIAAACAARRQAYAPYSGFLVGAAVQSDDGLLAAGCNVESVSYGLTICAERAAAFASVAAGRRRLAAIAVASSGAVPPCGACRQVLAEFADDLIVLLVDADHPEQVREFTLGELLPHRFSPSALGNVRPSAPGQPSLQSGH